jgi:hypothetical protein
MTLGKRLIQSAKEAQEIAKCDHTWIELEHHPSSRRKWWCKKCKGLMYTDDAEWPNR